MNDVIARTLDCDYPEIMQHPEGFDFVRGNRSLSAAEVSLVNVMSMETILRQFVGIVKWNYGTTYRVDAEPRLFMLGNNLITS